MEKILLLSPDVEQGPETIVISLRPTLIINKRPENLLYLCPRFLISLRVKERPEIQGPLTGGMSVRCSPDGTHQQSDQDHP
jgi:hypothetical protein